MTGFGKRTKLACIVAILIVLSASGVAKAGSFTCHSAHGGYCAYVGKVSRVYVNEGNVILAYFASDDDPALLQNTGITGVTAYQAGSYIIGTSPTFAEYLYSTLLTAKTTDRPVVMQFRGSAANFVKIDRNWLD